MPPLLPSAADDVEFPLFQACIRVVLCSPVSVVFYYLKNIYIPPELLMLAAAAY